MTTYFNSTYIQDDDVTSTRRNENADDCVHVEVPTLDVKETDNTAPQDDPDVKETGKTTPQDGSTYTLHEIEYSIDVKTRPLCGRTVKRKILKEISAVFRPGLNAVIGPTGCGKSTLLDIIAGRKNPKGLAGLLLLDGSQPPHNFKCMVGYVTQDDYLMGTLTVKENIQFSAALRLPRTISNSQRNQKVSDVITELDLEHCAKSKVGTDFSRGISGGERKRCHIAIELIISPPILVLDEPTSGLDAFTAITVLKVLKMLSRRRTIIFSIHQPRFNIFRLFDHLTLISMGELAYHGPATECQQFFQSIGYICEEYNNPADFVLDVLSGEKETDIDTSIHNLSEARLVVHKKIVDAYKRSSWKQNITSELSIVLQEHEENDQNKTVSKIDYATGPFVQFLYCAQRDLRNIFRNRMTTAMLFFWRAILGLFVGALYWKIDDSCRSGLQNRIGAFFLLATQTVFVNLSAIELFLNNREFFLHENAGGFYRTSSYFAASILCDVLLIRLLPASINIPIVYFMLDFKADLGHFFTFYFALLAASIAATSLGFFISAVVRNHVMANLLATSVFIVMMMFSGLLVNIASLPYFLQWLKHFSILRYCMTVLSINELRDMTFSDDDSNTTCTSGSEYLKYQGINFETSWDISQNFIALVLISIVFLILTYLRLRFMNKLK